jgi:glycosyltransferase involved in cell wall biosynthesis
MKRLKVGISFFSNYKTWAGGVIYILNIISSLYLLPDELKPELFIYYNRDSPISDIEKIQYPYIKFFEFKQYPPSTLKKILNYIFIKVFNGTFFFNEKPDLVYPYVKYLCYGNRCIFWIPDFQEYYYPDLFSKEDIRARMKRHVYISKNSKGIVVFSSQDATNDFKKFYPDYKCTTALVRFACILPEFKHISLDSIRARFGIRKKFFMITNQFWAHKNHKVVLEAVNELKDKKLDFQIVLTGSTRDKRNPFFFDSLMEYISLNNISEYFVFLGFIEREEQLKLMDEALAIIQPSLFEGWSTVVEDAKALSQNIILSNLSVHREQISENCRFFDPHNFIQLSSIMEEIIANKPERLLIDYSQNIKRFGEEFLDVLSSIEK